MSGVWPTIDIGHFLVAIYIVNIIIITTKVFHNCCRSETVLQPGFGRKVTVTVIVTVSLMSFYGGFIAQDFIGNTLKSSCMSVICNNVSELEQNLNNEFNACDNK